MKKLLSYILAVAALSGCVTIASEEYPSDRVGEMAYYAKLKVYNEVQETVRYLSMAVRLDEYTNLPEQDKMASRWNDIRGNVYVNDAGRIELVSFGTYETGHTRLGEEGAEWIADKTSGSGGIGRRRFVCTAPSTWVCTAEVPGGWDNALKAVLRDKDKGLWGLEYSSSEKDGEHSAVFSSTGLEAGCVAKYGQTYYYQEDSPVTLKGVVRVDFFQSGEKTDWLELEWSGSGEPSVKSNRD